MGKPFYVSQLPEGVQNKLKEMQKKKLLEEGYSEKDAEYYADEFLNEKIYTAEEFYGNNFWERPEFKEEPKSADKLDHEIVNDFSIDAIKDNFTPPGAKGEKKMNKRMFSPDMLCPKCNEPMLYQAGGGKIKCHKCGNEIKDETLDTLDLYKSPNIDKEDVKDEIDTNDNGKIEVDEMADFQKSLDDYASKNKKGREDIPVGYRR